MTSTAAPPADVAWHRPILWQQYASEGLYGAPRHLRWLDDQVAALASEPDGALCVSFPPGHGKTTFLAHNVTTWWLGRNPTHRVIYVSMQERFSRKQGRAARDLFASKAEDVFGVTCHRRASTAEWQVTRDGWPTGGGMVSVGARGTITGERADLIVVDDLIRDNKEALNPRLMEEIWDWFRMVVTTRGKPGCRFIVLMTRWSHIDLISRLMQEQEDAIADGKPVRWRFVNLPAIAEENDPLNRQPGEALWPEEWPVSLLEKRKARVGPYAWESLYQGRPTPKSGGIFKAGWLKSYERHGDLVSVGELGTCSTRDLIRFGVADLATSTKRRADYTVTSAWGWHPKWRVLLLLGLERARLAGHEYVPAFRRLVEVHSLPIVYCEREGPIVRERIGFSVVQESVRSGLPVVEITPDGDKRSRALAATGAFASGQVWFPDARRCEWRPALDLELLTFDSGEHDDQVDVCTYAVGLFKRFMDEAHSRERARRGQTSGGGGSIRTSY